MSIADVLEASVRLWVIYFPSFFSLFLVSSDNTGLLDDFNVVFEGII